jgi:uncharacterized protein YukE
MVSSDLLKVGKGELQAHAVRVRSLAGQMDQTISQTEQRIQALLDSWLGLGATASATSSPTGIVPPRPVTTR